jgi:hypothetical protein
MTLHYTNRFHCDSRQSGRGIRSPRAAHPRGQFSALTLVALLLVSAPAPVWAQANPPLEYQVKAAFLLNFAKFVEWPTDAFPGDKAPITFCVFGHDPFGSALDELIRGKTINSREVLARRINELPDLRLCQLVFVSDREDKRLSEILNSLRGASTLVVGEGDGFAERGGAIQFFLEDNRLRFAVNVDAVQKARLTVSSKLLALARIVHDGRQKGS